MAHHRLQHVLRLEAPVGNVFAHLAPLLAVLWFGRVAPLDQLLLLLLRPVLQLELVEIGPRVTEIGIDFYLFAVGEGKQQKRISIECGEAEKRGGFVCTNAARVTYRPVEPVATFLQLPLAPE